jgi:hypothetical protein
MSNFRSRWWRAPSISITECAPNIVDFAILTEHGLNHGWGRHHHKITEAAETQHKHIAILALTIYQHLERVSNPGD